MHEAKDVKNPSLITTIQIEADKKPEILQLLHRFNINQFTTYDDLDHLSKEIKKGWGV